jgi:hypothetical protein
MSALGRRARALSIGLAVLAAARPIGAQTLPDDSTGAPIEFRVPAPTGALVGAGVLATGVSWVGGIMVGARIGRALSSCEYGCDFDGFGGSVLGALFVPAIAVPLTVHHINDGAGSLGVTLVTTIAAGVLGAFVGAHLWGLDGLVLVPPIAELITAVAVEQATTFSGR